MTSGYSISLIIDSARGTSQLYLSVAWTLHQTGFSFLSSQQLRHTHVNISIHISNVLEVHVLQRENITGKAKEDD